MVIYAEADVDIEAKTSSRRNVEEYLPTSTLISESLCNTFSEKVLQIRHRSSSLRGRVR